MKPLLAILIICTMSTVNAQNQLPYYEIPDAPSTYEPGNIMARMLDGWGFRYYWASEGLTEDDLNYKPSENARSTRSTIDHICGLSNFVLSTVKPDPNSARIYYRTLSYDEVRAITLKNIKTISDELKGKSAEEIATIEIVMGSGDKKRTMPFWNLINGPIEDAVYHTGQVVSFRRASGNPINPNISVLTGKLRN